MKTIIVLLLVLLPAIPPSFAAGKDEGGKPSTPAAGKKTVPDERVQLIDINTATETQLKALPGIGQEHVEKIISNRPYTRKEELLLKGIVPPAIYELIKDRIKAAVKAER